MRTADKAKELKLYQHAIRNDWGLAALAWERGNRMAFQFEDGTVREFKVDTPLMRRVPKTERNREAARILSRRLKALEAQRRQRVKQRRVARRAKKGTLKKQVDALLDEYPGGFAGDRWLVRMRGHGAKRRLKRHREPALLGAQQRLGQLVVDQLVANGELKKVHELAIDTFRGTNLVPWTQVKPLEKMNAQQIDAFSVALKKLLYGRTSFDHRFEAFVEACDVHKRREPGWELVTAPCALVHPKKHVCVHPATFVAQAEHLETPLELPDRPSAAAYREALAVARGVREACIDRRVKPRDLLDVRDFMQLTVDEV